MMTLGWRLRIVVRAKGYVAQVKNQDREGGFIKKVERYERRVPQALKRWLLELGGISRTAFLWYLRGVKTESSWGLESTFIV